MIKIVNNKLRMHIELSEDIRALKKPNQNPNN